jgi:hypothetical protein
MADGGRKTKDMAAMRTEPATDRPSAVIKLPLQELRGVNTLGFQIASPSSTAISTFQPTPPPAVPLWTLELVSAMGTRPLVLLSRPVGNVGAGISAA